jgi:hypothetical protein
MPKKAQSLIVSFSELKPWKDNPRNATDADLERLRKQIVEIGVYKPLICVKEDGKYLILGGNMRYKIYKKLGHKKVWIVVVDAKTKTKRLKYALSDNDRVGYYSSDKLAELFTNVSDATKEFSDFRVDIFPAEIDVAFALETINYEKDTSDIVKQFPTQKISEKNANWFYIEFYKDKKRFRELMTILEPILKGKHEIPADIFYKAILHSKDIISK